VFRTGVFIEDFFKPSRLQYPVLFLVFCVGRVCCELQAPCSSASSSMRWVMHPQGLSDPQILNNLSRGRSALGSILRWSTHPVFFLYAAGSFYRSRFATPESSRGLSEVLQYRRDSILRLFGLYQAFRSESSLIPV